MLVVGEIGYTVTLEHVEAVATDSVRRTVGRATNVYRQRAGRVADDPPARRAWARGAGRAVSEHDPAGDVVLTAGRCLLLRVPLERFHHVSQHPAGTP